MKKLLSLLLVLLLTLSLAFMATACSSDSDKDDDDDDKKSSTSQKKDDEEDEDEDEEVSIVGKWEAELDVADMVNAAMEDELGAELGKTFSNLPVTLTMEFDKKEVEITMSADGLEDKIKKQMPNVLKAVLETMLEESGMDMSIDEFLEAQGMDMDEFIEEAMSEMDMSEITDSFNNSTTYSYELDGKKLYTFEDEKDEDEYMEIKLSSKKFVVEKAATAEELPEFMEGFMDGLEFKKVK